MMFVGCTAPREVKSALVPASGASNWKTAGSG